ncbi:signal peptidase II [Swaminathania salitolerans]|uniref:Lipoprotein signal peptidase n=1 Tax=Swaminathania salitolerans TaxID=182838 RepID=A0A511BKL3_9PROT|nr:signal peptidase II [Swaminathania salitolerans]GBQ09632.1 lipoprotein signal peptidase [Swaminathania salitolerans LMG 21291]GEL00899.1 lipoprotein signal peptidase [Swaminathania salitolerans]
MRDSPKPRVPARPRPATLVAGCVTFLAVLIADQLSKWWILDIYRLPVKQSVAIMPGLNFTMVWNHAVTFGMLGGLGRFGPAIFCAVALIAVLALLAQTIRTPRMVVAIASAGIAGGAVGNVIDRLRFGAVVDFIHAHAFGWSWYVFNVADSAIVCGVVLWIADTILADRRAAKRGH